MALKRLQKEAKDIAKEALPNITASPISELDMLKWSAVIDGPEGSPYEGGKFKVSITFPLDYPMKAPFLKFETKVFHPNVGSCGSICLDILKTEWTPALSITKVLLSLSSLLTDPNANSPLNSEAARYYKNDIEKYNEIVRDYVQKYAM